MNKNDFGTSKEGPVATAIESQTAKIPSDFFLWAALGSMATSLGLRIAGKKDHSLFVGQWAAPFLLLGLYNKVVKLEGHDKEDRQHDNDEDEKKDTLNEN